MELVWKRRNHGGSENIGKLYYYDCGAYIGFLFENEWLCYHILSRNTSENGNILECVKKMPEEWVPHHVYSVEELEVFDKTANSFTLNEWFIELPREQEQVQVHQQPQQQSRSQLQVQGKDRARGTNRHPHTYSLPSSQQAQQQRQQPQQPHEQHQPSPQSYHQQHTSYSPQKSSSQHQQKKLHQQRREKKQPLMQYKNNIEASASPLSSSDSTSHERHQSQRQSQRERQTSQLREVAHSGPQWTSLQSLLVSPTLVLPHVASPKPALKPLLPTPSSEYPSDPVRHSHEQRASHRQKSKHLQRPGGSSKQRPRHHVSPQSDPQCSPSM